MPFSFSGFFTAYRFSILIRVVSVVLILACLFFLPERVCMFLFITLGLAHFGIAFWYQCGAGRWKLPSVGLLFLAFAGISFLVNATYTAWFFVLTGVYTTLHMAWDEVHLLKGTHSLYTTLELAPFVVLYGGLLTDANFGTSFFVPALSVSLTCFAVYGILSLSRRRPPNGVSFVNLGWGVFAFAVYLSFLFSTNVPPYLWFLGLAVVHYFIWYGEYARKVSTDTSRKKTYYFRIITVNVVLFAGLLAWLSTGFALGGILYAPTFFYAWAFLHVTTSLRLSDLSRMFSLE